MSGGLERSSYENGVYVGTFHDVLITLWNGPLTAPTVRSMRASFTRLTRAYPAGIYTMALVPEAGQRITPMDDGERGGLISLVREFAKPLKATAYVIEAGGFVGAMTRSVLSGLNLALSAGFTAKTFIDVEASELWLRGKGACGGTTAGALRTAVDEARASMK